MPDKKKLAAVITRGFEDERASVAWSVVSGGISSDLDVTVFLVSSGVDWVRRGAADAAHINPFDPPMKDMIPKLRDAGGKILVCPPCANVRGYEQDDLVDGVVITGARAMHELVRQGAAPLCF